MKRVGLTIGPYDMGVLNDYFRQGWEVESLTPWSAGGSTNPKDQNILVILIKKDLLNGTTGV